MRLALVILGLVALMLVPVLLFDDEIESMFAGEEGIRLLQSYGPWAWAAGILLIVSDLVLPVPSTAVISALGMIYGPWLGGLIGGIGSTLAGLVAYGGCRMLGNRFFHFLVGDTNLGKLGRFFDRFGLAAIVLSRWMPILPEALACLAGAARMRFIPFLAALACGSFAMRFAFAFLGTAYLDRPALGLAMSALLPIAVWPILHIMLRSPKTVPQEMPSD
jgi:uncharacterized membrane protein YdjX (TVP38/TMEM64 family)